MLRELLPPRASRPSTPTSPAELPAKVLGKELSRLAPPQQGRQEREDLEAGSRTLPETPSGSAGCDLK